MKPRFRAPFHTKSGNIAQCAGGPRAFKYGVTKQYVLGLEAVLPTGEIVRTGGKTVKNVVGYDLTQLLVGSEGTLAVITKAILRLVPKPAVQATLRATFETVDVASIASETVPTEIDLGSMVVFCQPASLDST